jgi:uncharacterized membrane protein
MAKHNLIAVRLPSKEQVKDLYQQLHTIDEADDNLKIVDAVGASKNEKGHIDIEQTHDVTATEGALGGGFVGMIVGVMIAGPVGLAVGALAGGALTGLYARLRDSGINDREIRDLARELQPGQALLFILYEGEVPPQALDTMRAYNAELVHAELPEDVRQQVTTALSAEAPAAASAAPVAVAAAALTVAVAEDATGSPDPAVYNATPGVTGEVY